MNALAPLALFLASLPGPSLELSAPETSVLVGEPVKVTVRWKATTDLPSVTVEDQEFLSQTLQFVVDGGTGPRRCQEYPRAIVDQVNEPGALGCGQEVIGNYVLLDGGYYAPGAAGNTPSLLFPRRASTRSRRSIRRARQTMFLPNRMRFPLW